MDSTDPNKVTDKCGNPLAQTCPPQTIRTQICYLTPTLFNAGVCCGLPGFKVIDIAADCSGSVTAIEDMEGNTVANAYEVPCPSTLGGGDIVYSNCPPPPGGGGGS